MSLILLFLHITTMWFLFIVQEWDGLMFKNNILKKLRKKIESI